MKKILTVLMAVLLLLACTACGGSGGGTSQGGAAAASSGGDGSTSNGDSSAVSSNNGGKTTPAPVTINVKGETKDVGDFTVLVPEGWMGNALTTKNQYHIYKGAKKESDMWSSPCVQITYLQGNTDDGMRSIGMMYEDVKELDPITIGNYKWNALTGIYAGNQVTFLYTTETGPFMIVVYTNVDGKTISVEDEDFQGIVNSLTLTKQ